MKLREILKEKSVDYYSRLKEIEKESFGILPDVRIVFPKYTNHDIAHTKGIETILDKMIPDSIKSNLKPAEIFYLIVATMFHDVGMKLIGESEEEEFNRLNEAGRERFRNNIRDQHHIRSSSYIRANAATLHLRNEEAGAIADISRAHRKINIQDELVDPIHEDGRIHLRFLGSLLRVADECHVTDDRVSELFLKTIKTTSWEFSKHFRKHRLITGILFNENDDCTIRINGIVESESDEDILDDISDDIKNRLDSVQELFEENELCLQKTSLELNKDELIKKKIILNLLDGKNKSINRISSDIDESESAVQKNLEDLIVEGTLKLIESSLYSLREDINNFEDLVKRFAGDNNNWKFIKSEYSQKMIENHLMSHIQSTYNVIYIGKEFIERAELLKNSPTAVYLSLQGKELLNNPYLDLSMIQGDVVLDQILLEGLSYDIFKYPISSYLDIKNIVESLTENTLLRMRELTNLYRVVQENSEKDDEELISELTSEIDGEERRYSFNMKLGSNVSGEPTFMSMLNAAMKTRTAIVITGGRILDFLLKEGNEPIHIEKVSAMELTPGEIKSLNLRIKNTDVGFDNLKVRVWEIDEITIFSTESRNFPFKFEMMFNNETRTNRAKFEIDSFTADVKHHLKYEDFLRTLNLERELILINPDNSEVFYEFESSPTKDTNDSWYEYLKKLVRIQESTGQKIKAFSRLNVDDQRTINFIMKIIDDGEVDIKPFGPFKFFESQYEVSKIKELIKDRAENDNMEFRVPAFLIKVLDKELDLGPVRILLKKFILEKEDAIKSELVKLDDKEILPIKIYPLDKEITLFFDNYP